MERLHATWIAFCGFVTALAASMNVTLGVVVGGTVGSSVSALFLMPAGTALRARLLYFGGGNGLALCGSGLVSELLGVQNAASMSGVALALGLWGIALVIESNDFIRSGGLRDVVRAWRAFRNPSSGGSTK